jgi:hypothetical protein
MIAIAWQRKRYGKTQKAPRAKVKLRTMLHYFNNAFAIRYPASDCSRIKEAYSRGNKAADIA